MAGTLKRVSEAAMSDQYQTARKPSRMPESKRPLVIAIDGPSGSGKSSTARGVAERLGLAFLDNKVSTSTTRRLWLTCWHTPR